MGSFLGLSGSILVALGFSMAPCGTLGARLGLTGQPWPPKGPKALILGVSWMHFGFILEVNIALESD